MRALYSVHEALASHTAPMNPDSTVVFSEMMLGLRRAATKQAVRRAAREVSQRLGETPVTRELAETAHSYAQDRLRHHTRRATGLGPGGNGGDYRLLQATGLTARECEVMRWLADGKRDRDRATILGIAVRTVRKHVEHIRAKLHVETRMAAVACAQPLIRRQR